MSSVKKVVLAYSGGLDTSIIIPWLKEHYGGAAVIAFCGDVGQGDDYEAITAKALATGASKCIVRDLREEFVRDYCYKALAAGAVYEDRYLLGTALARPLLAYHQVQVALEEGADALSHGATGKGNDQVRFELSAYALNPDIQVIAPWREWDLKGRADCIRYAQKYGIPIPVTADKPYSTDANLLHISYEGGILEDPWAEPEEDMWRWSVSPEKAPDKPTYVELTYTRGDITAIDGKAMTPAQVMEYLNKVGGDNGIGRDDIVENRYVGMKIGRAHV